MCRRWGWKRGITNSIQKMNFSPFPSCPVYLTCGRGWKKNVAVEMAFSSRLRGKGEEDCNKFQLPVKQFFPSVRNPIFHGLWTRGFSSCLLLVAPSLPGGRRNTDVAEETRSSIINHEWWLLPDRNWKILIGKIKDGEKRIKKFPSINGREKDFPRFESLRTRGLRWVGGWRLGSEPRKGR